MPLNYSDFSSDSNIDSKFKDMQNKYANGRVTMPSVPTVPFELFQGERQETVNSYQVSTQGTLETTPVSSMFFSNDNKEYIQNRLIDDVFKMSNNKHIISRQSDLHLLIIMRSIYFQYGRNVPCDIKEQVFELNEMVIKDCVSRILVEIEQRNKYTDFVTHLPQQIPLPKNMSIKGDKMLYSKIG